MHNITLTAQADIELSADKPKVNALAYSGASVRVAGYRTPMVVDVGGVEMNATVPLLYGHNHDSIVGYGTVERNGDTLSLSGTLAGKSAERDKIVDLASDGFQWGVSIGVKPSKIEEVKAGQSVTVNGQTFTGPLAVVRAGHLYEVSFVAVGADRFAHATIAAQFNKEEDNMEFADFVAASGFDVNSLTDTQRGALQLAYNAEHKSADDIVSDAKLEAAYSRIIDSAISRGMQPEQAEALLSAARADGLSAMELELQVLRATRHEGSTRTPSTRAALNQDVIECAVARSIGDSDVTSHFKEEVLEASERQFKHGLSLIELLQMSAKAKGHRDISHRDIRGLLQAAFEPVRMAGPSTYDVSGVLSNVANKSILAGFNSVEQEWRKVSAVRPVNDLKQITSYSLTGDFVYQQVGPSGELTHATLGEQNYTNQAKTYGRLFAITRSDLLNDDLGAFMRVRQMLGRGAALKFNSVFWTEFLADVATFYTLERKNYLEGGTTGLDIESLSKAFQTLEDQTDPDGNPLGLSAAVLAVPSALKILGNQLVNDPEIRINGAQSKMVYFTSNPHAGKVSLCSSTYLNNASIPNGSSKHWFLMASPMDMPVIESVFLFGRQEPTIEQADADFDTLGIQMRGYHDFGVKKQEFRGAVRVKGEA